MSSRGWWQSRLRAGGGHSAMGSERTVEYEERFAAHVVTAARGYSDEVIMAHATRKRRSRVLAMLLNKKLENPWKKHDNIPL